MYGGKTYLINVVESTEYGVRGEDNTEDDVQHTGCGGAGDDVHQEHGEIWDKPNLTEENINYR